MPRLLLPQMVKLRIPDRDSAVAVLVRWQPEKRDAKGDMEHKRASMT